MTGFRKSCALCRDHESGLERQVQLEPDVCRFFRWNYLRAVREGVCKDRQNYDDLHRNHPSELRLHVRSDLSDVGLNFADSGLDVADSGLYVADSGLDFADVGLDFGSQQLEVGFGCKIALLLGNRDRYRFCLTTLHTGSFEFP